jgi:hypothetical protein
MDFPDFNSKVTLWKILWKENWFIHLYMTVVSPVKFKQDTVKIQINLTGGKKCYNYLKDGQIYLKKGIRNKWLLRSGLT